MIGGARDQAMVFDSKFDAQSQATNLMDSKKADPLLERLVIN